MVERTLPGNIVEQRPLFDIAAEIPQRLNKEQEKLRGIDTHLMTDGVKGRRYFNPRYADVGVMDFYALLALPAMLEQAHALADPQDAKKVKYFAAVRLSDNTTTRIPPWRYFDAEDGHNQALKDKLNAMVDAHPSMEARMGIVAAYTEPGSPLPARQMAQHLHEIREHMFDNDRYEPFTYESADGPGEGLALKQGRSQSPASQAADALLPVVASAYGAPTDRARRPDGSQATIIPDDIAIAMNKGEYPPPFRGAHSLN